MHGSLHGNLIDAICSSLPVALTVGEGQESSPKQLVAGERDEVTGWLNFVRALLQGTSFIYETLRSLMLVKIDEVPTGLGMTRPIGVKKCEVLQVRSAPCFVHHRWCSSGTGDFLR